MPKNRVDRQAFFAPQRLGLWLLAAWLSGCAVQPIQDAASFLTSVPRAELERVAALETQGQTATAAKQYLELAERATAPAKAELQLKAAQAYRRVGQVAAARQALADLKTAELVKGQLERARLLKAELALAAHEPKTALTELQSLPPSLPKLFTIQRLGLLAAAQRLANNPAAAAAALIELDAHLDAAERLAHQVALVATLALMNAADLSDLTKDGKGTLAGWAELAQLMRRDAADPTRLEQSYQRWRTQHRSHPALPELARAYSGAGDVSGQPVTVLLPNRGRFAVAAKAVRDGLEAASRATPNTQRAKLNFVDSTHDRQVRALQTAAVERGAQAIIGPLEKPAVERLLSAGASPVPTLALNESSQNEGCAANLFQFALAPENEATEAANKGLALGAKRALILHPSDAWGPRLASAFAAQWRAQGGTVAGQAAFNPTAAKRAGQTIKRLLANRDADLLFLVATTEMARALHPQIQAAAKQPLIVMATSHVYSGRFDPRTDQALIGLYFVDIPWMLDLGGAGPLARRTVMGETTSAAGPLARLYAMGIDAYRLTPQLPTLAQYPGAYFPGLTGGLALDPLGRVTRQLALGRFTASGPRLVEDTRTAAKP